MSFQERLQLAQAFSAQCRRYFQSQKLECRDWGEHEALAGIPLSARMKMPKEIRYQPDFIVFGASSICDSQSFGVDAKSGSEREYCTIEKNAYLIYSAIDVAMPIFVLTDRSVHDKKRWVSLCRVSCLRFIDSHGVVFKFRFSGCGPFPIDDDGWIVPPRNSNSASGTPYKAIDYRCLRDICTKTEWERLYGGPQKSLF